MLQALIDYLNERKDFQKRIQDLEEENRELKYQPGGPGAIEAKEHFEHLSTTIKK